MIIDPNNQSQMTNMPNMVKRGFNQTPDDIRDRINSSQMAYKKQAQIPANKENKGNPSLDIKDKISALKKLNNRL